MEVYYHFICDQVTNKEIQFRLISSKDQLADVITKPLLIAFFAHLQFKLRFETPSSA
jgi:hypothetical protein